MKRLCNNYMQLTGPVFDPRSATVADMNQNSLEIPDLTGIPQTILMEYLKELKKTQEEMDDEATNHSGDNFKRFCLAYNGLKKKVDAAHNVSNMEGEDL